MATAEEEQQNLRDFRAIRDRVLGAIPEGSHNGTKARLLTSNDGGYIVEQVGKTFSKADGAYTNEQIAKLDVVLSRVVTALANVSGGEAFDEGKLLESIRAASAEASAETYRTLAESVRAELTQTIEAAVLSAVEAADIPDQAREGLQAAVRSITTTTVVDVAEGVK